MVEPLTVYARPSWMTGLELPELSLGWCHRNLIAPAAASGSSACSPCDGRYARPPNPTAEDVVWQDVSYWQTTRPVCGSWAVSPGRDCISTRSPPGFVPRSTVGEDQIAPWSRSIRHRVWPVAVSIPAANDSPWFSHCTTTVGPTISGEEPMPTSLRVVGFSYPNPRNQRRLPSRSKQARSLEE